MTCSPARLEANRANSLKSRGPATAEGKAASRANAYKHGLTGDGVVIPEADMAAVRARVADFHDDIRPIGGRSVYLSRRAALMSLRVDKCMALELANNARRVRRAEADYDLSRQDEADTLIGSIGVVPSIQRRRLLQSPEGVDRLIGAFKGLRLDLDQGRWSYHSGLAAVYLMGIAAVTPPRPRLEVLSNVSLGIFADLGHEDGGWLDREARMAWGREELGKAIDAEIAGLETHRATIDGDAIAEDRAGAPARAWFDPSKEAILLRKYEAAADRAFFRALKEIEAIEAARKAQVEAGTITPPTEPTPDHSWASGSLASFFRGLDGSPSGGPIGSGPGCLGVDSDDCDGVDGPIGGIDGVWIAPDPGEIGRV